MLTPLERAIDIGNRLNGGYCNFYEGNKPDDIFDDAPNSKFLCRLEFSENPCYRIEGNQVVLLRHSGTTEEDGKFQWARYFSADGKAVFQCSADDFNLNNKDCLAGGTITIFSNKISGNIDVYLNY